MSKHIMILGGGSGGISTAARLKNLRPELQITIVDASERHYYQAYWTLVGGGVGKKETTSKPMLDVIPKGVKWVKDGVKRVKPEQNEIELISGVTLNYDFLIVATGLKLDWDKVQGLEGNVGRNGICSIYEYSQVDYAAHCVNEFKGGEAIFVMPPVPIKCAGAPQKIMYLAEHQWRNRGIRRSANVRFMTAGKAMFGIPTFSDPLTAIVKERGILPHYQHRLVSVDADSKKATFEVKSGDLLVGNETFAFDLLHVVPPMSAHSYVALSGLSFDEGDQKGWLAVDKFTLQHLRFKNIFGVGDVTGVPNSKTAAAIRKQYPIVAQNLIDVVDGKSPSLSYDGYSSCPLTTEIGKVMLAEFGYEGKILPSFPLDPAVPRKAYWHLKKDFLPPMYWHGMLKGRF